MKYAFIAGTLILTAYGQIIMKSRALVLSTQGTKEGKFGYLVAMFSDIWVISGLMAAVIAASCWMLAIQQTPISVAYPFMALSFVVIPVLAMLFLGESVSFGQWCGMVLIVVGISVAAITK
jgi:drug/metabolite transporter (DMT)-like permease